MASSPQQHPFGFRGNNQRETFMWLPVNLPGRQPVMLAVVVGDAINATDTGMMTWYDISLIIKCSGSHHVQIPQAHQYGINTLAASRKLLS